MLEFAIVATLGLTLVFALVDFGRALNLHAGDDRAEQARLEPCFKGGHLVGPAQAVIAGDAPLDLNNNGEVIVTAVTNAAGGTIVTGQAVQGKGSQGSKIGRPLEAAALVPCLGRRDASAGPDHLHYRGVLLIPTDHANREFFECRPAFDVV